MKYTNMLERTYAFIVAFHAENDCMPTIKELSEGMGHQHVTNGQYAVKQLIKLGKLEKRGNKYRFSRQVQQTEETPA
jgi:SOS-response transcriptional repressor LexA